MQLDIGLVSKHFYEDIKFLFTVKQNINNISQNFGECLAPIVFGKPNNKVEFSGNEPVVDVKLNNVSIAVKSLSGSGKKPVGKMADVIDAYQDTIDPKRFKKSCTI